MGPAEALELAAHPALLAVAALLLFQAGLARSGLLDWAAGALGRGRRVSLARLEVGAALLGALAGPEAAASAFLPPVFALAERRGDAPSRLVLPVSACAAVGGAATWFGSASWLVASTLERGRRGGGAGAFDLAPLALALLPLAAAWLAVARRWLPARRPLGFVREPDAAGRFVVEVWLEEGSPLAGGAIGAALGELRAVRLVRDGAATLAPPPGTELRAGDALLLEGEPDVLQRLVTRGGARLADSVAPEQAAALRRAELATAETAVAPFSAWRGRTVSRLRLFEDHGVAVLALRRRGGVHRYDAASERLRAGDVLLLQGPPEAVARLQGRGDAVVLAAGVPPPLPARPARAAVVLGAALAATAAGVAAPAVVFTAGALLFWASGALTVRAALRALDLAQLLPLLAGLAAGPLLREAGLAAGAGNLLAGASAGAAAPWALAGICLLAALLAGFVPPAAVAAALGSAVLEAAAEGGAAAGPWLRAASLGAAASFLGPWGSATAAFVRAPGGYRWREFLHSGLPVAAAAALAAGSLVPLLC